MSPKIINADELKERLSYNPITGDFTWLTGYKRIIGNKAGTPHHGKYIYIRMYKRGYLAHRLAFLYMTGSFPINVIDHIDGNGMNNSWANLRAVTIAENQQNQKIQHTNNKSGLLGVIPKGGFFAAQISVNKKQIYLGSFPTPQEAHQAYLKAKREMHPCSTI